MTEIAARLKAALLLLPAQDRAELAHFLIQSLDEEADADAAAAWDAELARRAAEIHSERALGEPADKVFAELRIKYKSGRTDWER